MQKFTRLMKRFPTIRFVLVMGPPAGSSGTSGKWISPRPWWRLTATKNLLIEVMFPITWGGKWDYPYPEAQQLIRGMRDMFGAAKLVWGLRHAERRTASAPTNRAWTMCAAIASF